MKKKLSAIILIITMFIIPYNAKANENVPCSSAFLNSLGEIKRNETITINEKEEKLYCTFIDQDKALKNFLNHEKKIIQNIQKEYKLKDFNNDTWQDYYKVFQEYITNYQNVTTNYKNEFYNIETFFDTYENNNENEKIKNLVNSRNKIFTNKHKETNQELAILLPITSVSAQQFNNNIISSNKRTIAKKNLTSYNSSSGINYAINYAKNPNTSSYYYFSRGDCANFASQILENMGVNQIVYNSTNSGWWHKFSNGKHTHSLSWTVANTFARYMGIGYSTRWNYDFSANIRAGDFIAADFNNDGSYDHIGFIVQRDNYHKYYDNIEDYYDYRVAQHTSNYLLWASNTNNNWEKIDDNGGSYARIRR